MLQNTSSLRKASAINVDNQQKVYTDKLSRTNSSDLYSIRLNQRSSLEVKVDGVTANTTVDLIRDRNNNKRTDEGERLSQSTATKLLSGNLQSSDLSSGNYYVRVSAPGKTNYRMAIASRPADQFSSWAATGEARALTPITISPGGGSSGGSSGSTGRWNASFINRTSRNVSDFRSYDFSRPNAVRDLGATGARNGVAARLKADFGKGKPAAGVNKDNFAAQISTRVDLKEGAFYRIRSASNDGTRFFFKNTRTGEIVKTFSGDWKNRSAKDPAWTQSIRVPEGGQYEFYVQYYERKGASVIDVSLEEIQLNGRVTNPTGVNVRQQPSKNGATLGNGLDNNEQFKILRQVNSTDSSGSWYEVQTRNGQRGFVSADNRLTQISDRSRVTDLTGGGGIFTPPVTDNPFPTPPSGGSSGTATGFIRSSGVALRNSPSTSGGILKDLSGKSSVKVVGKETGSGYGDIFDQWYKVEAGGQTGYVAAYYVEVENFNGKFSTGLNANSDYYRSHFNEARSYKSGVEQVSAKYGAWLKPSIVAAIGSRESGWGLLLDSQGKGDNGYGHGIMQIDSDYHKEFIASGKWRNPVDNIDYALNNVLAPYYSQLQQQTNLRGFELLRGAIAAYNAGPGGVIRAVNEGKDVDAYTTGGDYSWDVVNRAGWFQNNGWA